VRVAVRESYEKVGRLFKQNWPEVQPPPEAKTTSTRYCPKPREFPMMFFREAPPGRARAARFNTATPKGGSTPMTGFLPAFSKSEKFKIQVRLVFFRPGSDLFASVKNEK